MDSGCPDFQTVGFKYCISILPTLSFLLAHPVGQGYYNFLITGMNIQTTYNTPGMIEGICGYSQGFDSYGVEERSQDSVSEIKS